MHPKGEDLLSEQLFKRVDPNVTGTNRVFDEGKKWWILDTMGRRSREQRRRVIGWSILLVRVQRQLARSRLLLTCKAAKGNELQVRSSPSKFCEETNLPEPFSLPCISNQSWSRDSNGYWYESVYFSVSQIFPG